MCIIAAKPAGVKMPSEATLRNMWERNNDGAGLMYPLNGKVHIEKGFMTYEAFSAHLEKLSSRMNLDSISVVMHFRITTHGGTKPENTHPFPITDSIGMLKKLVCDTPLGIAHNGVIDIAPRKGISDTMEYIASQLTPLYKGAPQFYKNKHLMELVNNATGSKLAFLLPNGKIYTVGDFVESGGIMYSNRSFEKTMSFRDYTCYNWDDEWLLAPNAMNSYEYRSVMWLDEAAGEYVVDEQGDMWTGDFTIDSSGKVYEYSYTEDALVLCPNWRAYNAEGMTLAYKKDSSFTTQELVLKT